MDFSFKISMRNPYILLIGMLILLVGCYPDIDYTSRGYTEKIIVEGIIESGKYPKIYLSLNVPLSESVDSTTIRDKVIRDAKVTVSDGNVKEILTSKWDVEHFPPYVYFGTEIKGQTGKTYHLKVEKGGYSVESQTTIPLDFQIDSVYIEPTSIDSLRTLSVAIKVNKDRKNAYRIYTKKSKDKRYIETPIVFNSDFSLDGLQKFTLSPLPNKNDSSFTEGKYFAIGDVVDIKVMAIDSTTTQFFKDLTMFSVIAGNISINEIKPLSSNIAEPGFGIWYGCAVQTKKIIIR
ncbi:MAG TPA: hypothetical protein PLO29_00960 [Paludibacter sp.]|jgi:hypothetical protein|nr:hypothetical protein [Paludibacter sp.]